MGGPCEIGDNGDKISHFWIYQFSADDGKAQLVAESEDFNRVGLQSTLCKNLHNQNENIFRCKVNTLKSKHKIKHRQQILKYPDNFKIHDMNICR